MPGEIKMAKNEKSQINLWVYFLFFYDAEVATFS